MVMALIAKNKIEFIKETIRRPDNKDQSLEYEKDAIIYYLGFWTRSKKKVIASIIFIETTKEMWIDLKEEPR